LQLVKPHNHQVNTAEQAIQKFIAALATTNIYSPLQFWDKLTLQEQNWLNLMLHSRINLTILECKTLNGPYNWNRYSFVPLGCKAVVYEDGDT
jgi:hypothetical protein